MLKKNHLGVLYLATTDFDLSRSTSISTCLCDHVVLTPVVTFPVEVVSVSWHVLPPSDHWYSQLQFLEFLSLWSSTSHYYDDSVLSYDIQHEKEYISNMCLCIDCVYRHMLLNWISVYYFAASNLVKSMHSKCTFSYLTDIFLYTLSKGFISINSYPIGICTDRD